MDARYALKILKRSEDAPHDQVKEAWRMALGALKRDIPTETTRFRGHDMDPEFCSEECPNFQKLLRAYGSSHLATLAQRCWYCGQALIWEEDDA